MIYSDRDILALVKEGKFRIEPFEKGNVGPSSIDLRLSDEFMVFKTISSTHVDPLKGDGTEYLERVRTKDFVIHPGEFVLASTVERITLPADVVGTLEGRSGWGRLGVIIHTAGFIDAGFSGQLTLEIANVGKMPVLIRAGSRICQLVLFRMTSEADVPYTKRKGSKYAGQAGPTASRIGKDDKAQGRGPGRKWGTRRSKGSSS